MTAMKRQLTCTNRQMSQLGALKALLLKRKKKNLDVAPEGSRRRCLVKYHHMR